MRGLDIRQLVVVGFLAMMASSASANTWYIKADGTGDAPTIQAGVDSAAVGDTVLVGPGTYSDTTQVVVDNETKAVNVHVYKDVVLVAEGTPRNTILDWSNGDYALFIDDVSGTTTVKGFRTYRKTADFYQFGRAIYCTSGVTLENNWIVSDTWAGAIRLTGDDPAPKVIRGNLLVGNSSNIVVNTSNVLIESNTVNGTPHYPWIEQPGDGVSWLGGLELAVRKNIFHFTGDDVWHSYPPPDESWIKEFNCHNPWILDITSNSPPEYDENGNFFADPEFCSVLGVNFNYYLQSDSPCAPGNHPHDPNILIGAFEVNCGEVATEKSTWGSIKSKFRK